MAPPAIRRSVGLKHPLPANYFVCPLTTPQEESSWIQTGLNALKALVRDTDLKQGVVEWTLDYDLNGLQIYWGSDIGNSDLTVFMSVTEIQGTLEEAAVLHAADTHEAYHKYIERYNKDVIDCTVLKTLAPPTKHHPHNYIGLKWLTLELPTAVRNRDFCFIECRDEFSFEDVNGWARVLHSMDLPWVPELRDSLGIVRANYENSGIVFREIPNKPGYLHVQQLWNTNLRGLIPTWIQRIGIKRRAHSLLAYDSYFRALRLGRQSILNGHELVPISSRRKCFLCQKTFGRFSKRQNCRRCGEVVCRHCNKKWEITDAKNITRFVRVCFKCSSGPPLMIVDDGTSDNESHQQSSFDDASSEPDFHHHRHVHPHEHRAPTLDSPKRNVSFREERYSRSSIQDDGVYPRRHQSGSIQPESKDRWAKWDDVSAPSGPYRIQEQAGVYAEDHGRYPDPKEPLQRQHELQKWTQGSSNDSKTVSKEKLVDLYRQLKQMNIHRSDGQSTVGAT